MYFDIVRFNHRFFKKHPAIYLFTNLNLVVCHPKISNMNIGRIRIGNYIISAICASIAGLILASRINVATAYVGESYILDSITAAIIGGVTFAGGEGFVIGALGGAALTSLLQYAGAESVGDYRKYIKGTLGDGLFYKQARADFDTDLASTNTFIQEAADSQRLANIYNALGTAISTYTQADALKSIGTDVRNLTRGKAARQTYANPMGNLLESVDVYGEKV